MILKNEIEKLIKPYFAEWQTKVDITAVLKYVKNKWARRFEIKDEIWIAIKRWIYEDMYQIPLKPLHLYIEQEEKDLLELLKKLCYQWQQ